MRGLLISLFLFLAPFTVHAADVYVLGEVHDNPAHHEEQARRVAALAPSALVFEMLTVDQAAKVTASLIGDAAALEAALNWADSGWPDFAMYYPIFASAPEAGVFGAAIPRADVRRVMSEGIDVVFGTDAARYGLTSDLPEDQQTAREALQMRAHCDALPESMLPMMVNIQRLRDAALARATLQAMQATGGPVVVITGNGHARRDWGMPAILAQAEPGLDIFALGQGEEGQTPPGGFDEVVFADAVERKDPCNAFK